jgi:hypothetical protein
MEEQTETTELDYEIVKEPNVERFFDYELELNDSGFLFDDEGNLMGALVEFKEYPNHETLTGIFDDLLLRAVQQTQEVDEDEAQEMIDECDDEDDFPDAFDVSNTFSVLFIVENHRGLYRVLLDCNDYWVGHSTGHMNDRWEI